MVFATPPPPLPIEMNRKVLCIDFSFFELFHSPASWDDTLKNILPITKRSTEKRDLITSHHIMRYEIKFFG